MAYHNLYDRVLDVSKNSQAAKNQQPAISEFTREQNFKLRWVKCQWQDE